MRFSVCWWNTGLAPPRGESKNHTHGASVAGVVDRIFRDHGVDLLCLGEVNSDSLAVISAHLTAPGVTVSDRSRDQDGTNFQMGFLYRSEKVNLSQSQHITEMVSQTKRRLAQLVKVTLSDGSDFSVFVVHWPSRLMIPADGNLRTMLGFALRQKIDDLLHSNPLHRVIVLGDFNDEPFNDSIASMLAATRDVEMLSKNPRLLYNPFWRMLSPVDLYGLASSPTNPVIGTYYYRSGPINRWFVFDQVLVSSALLGKDIWHLDETATCIWQNPHELKIPPSTTVDHVPIFAAFERELS